MTALDRQIATEVMKQRLCCCAKPHIGWEEHLCLKCGGVVDMEYSTDIAAAWQVVDQLVKSGWHFRIDGWSNKEGYSDGYWAKFSKDISDIEDGGTVSISASMTICLAALEAAKK